MTAIPVKQPVTKAPARRVRPRRDFAAMEERRMRAADFIRARCPSSRGRASVRRVSSDRVGLARRVASVRSRRTACGRASWTTAEAEVELIKGAAANGYPNDLWTLKRAAEVIERVTGVSYHPARVWYNLRHGLNWSWQRPARRATERNDEAIQGSPANGTDYPSSHSRATHRRSIPSSKFG